MLLSAAMSLALLTGQPLHANQKPRFEDEIVAFETADKQAMPKAGSILFVGSSSIRLWKTLAEDFPEYPVLNRGFGGSWMTDSTRLVDRIVIPYKPRAIVVFAGTNDIADGHTPTQVADDYKSFVGKVRKKFPRIPIAYIATTPAPSRQRMWTKFGDVNGQIREFSKHGKGLWFIDTAYALMTPEGGPRPELFVEDQLHMNAQGYAIWREIVGKTLHEMVPPATIRR